MASSSKIPWASLRAPEPRKKIAAVDREELPKPAFSPTLGPYTPGDPIPSPEDIRLTAEVGRAGDLLGIDVLDHVIVGRGVHTSLREKGLYAPTSGASTPTP